VGQRLERSSRLRQLVEGVRDQDRIDGRWWKSRIVGLAVNDVQVAMTAQDRPNPQKRERLLPDIRGQNGACASTVVKASTRSIRRHTRNPRRYCLRRVQAVPRRPMAVAIGPVPAPLVSAPPALRQLRAPRTKPARRRRRTGGLARSGARRQHTVIRPPFAGRTETSVSF
jgi:hypothetical protein